MKAGQTVGRHLGKQLLHRVRVGGIEADQRVDGLAVGLPHLPLRMLPQLVGRVLELAVRDQRQPVPTGLVHRLPQHVTVAQTGGSGHALRVVEGEVAVPHPDHQVLGLCGHAAAHDLRAVEVARVVRGMPAAAKLRAGRPHFHPDQDPLEPGCPGGFHSGDGVGGRGNGGGPRPGGQPQGPHGSKEGSAHGWRMVRFSASLPVVGAPPGPPGSGPGRRRVRLPRRPTPRAGPRSGPVPPRRPPPHRPPRG